MIEFPKYIKEVLAEGRLRIFEEHASMVKDIFGYEGYTFFLFPSDAWVRASTAENDSKTIALAEKIVKFVQRNGGLAEIGSWDWIYHLPYDEETHTHGVAEKVYFLKIAITDPVCKVIEDTYGIDHLLDADRCHNAQLKPFVGSVYKRGWFLKKNVIPFQTEKLEDDAELYNANNLILYARCDHDKYRWWVKWFDDELAHCHKDLVSHDELMAIGNEATAVVNDIMAGFPNGVVDIKELIRKKKCEVLSDQEGNLFYRGKNANFWIRLIARQGDYNAYVKAFNKES